LLGIAVEIVGTDRSVLAADGNGNSSRQSVADAASAFDYRQAAWWLVLHSAGLPSAGSPGTTSDTSEYGLPSQGGARAGEAMAGTASLTHGFGGDGASSSAQSRPLHTFTATSGGLGTLTTTSVSAIAPMLASSTATAAFGSSSAFCPQAQPGTFQPLASAFPMADAGGSGPRPQGMPVTLEPPPDTQLARYPFPGNSANSTDTAPLSTASALAGTGLGTLAYGTSGNPPPALRLAAGVVPAAIDGTMYLSFTVTASPGHRLNLNSLTFDLARVFTGNYSVRYALRTSVDGFLADVLSGTVTTGDGIFGAVTADLSDPAYDGRGSVTFRLYFWDSNNGSNNAILLDNLTLVGAVTVPEPAEYAGLAALSLLGWLTYWRWNAIRRS
jgi:hypothetical protein